MTQSLLIRIKDAFAAFDHSLDDVLDHELGKDEFAALSMGLALRLVQFTLGRNGIACDEVATSLCRELVALGGNTRVTEK